MSRATEIAKTARYTRRPNGDLSVEGAAIIYKNFSGRPTPINPAGGKRTFNLVVPKELADDLVSEGWNVKYRPPREEGDDDMFYTEIVVRMDSQYPPKMFLIFERADGSNMIQLNEETVHELDDNRLKNVDLIIHPFAHGRVNAAGSTVKGYLTALYATQDPMLDFDGKYERFMH